MISPHRFVALDRAYTLAAGTALPNQLRGAVLLADLGGFTPLTEAFSAALGPQHGAEAITRLLDQVFDTLMSCVHRYGGVVPSFIGDALLTMNGDVPLPDLAACKAGRVVAKLRVRIHGDLRRVMAQRLYRNPCCYAPAGG